MLSGNRNFEGRVNPLTKANYLASPPLVVAYALAGTTDIDLTTEPIGKDSDGNDVFLQEIWPTAEEIRETIADVDSARDVYRGNTKPPSPATNCGTRSKSPAARFTRGMTRSTYIQHPPFLDAVTGRSRARHQPIHGARVLALLVIRSRPTTFRPPVRLPPTGLPGKYLQEQRSRHSRLQQFRISPRK